MSPAARATRPGAEECPSWSGAAHVRNLSSAALRMTYRIHVHGAHHIGTVGPLLLVTRCEGILVAPILHAVAPRPLHVIANAAMQQALPDAVMSRTGDIPVSGPSAIRTQRQALAALDDGRAVAMTGTSVPVGYLVGVSGVEVMPVVLFGATGKVATDPPRPRSRIDVVFAPRVAVAVSGDPLQTRTRAAVAEQVRQILSDAEELASMRLGQD